MYNNWGDFPNTRITPAIDIASRCTSCRNTTRRSWRNLGGSGYTKKYAGFPIFNGEETNHMYRYVFNVLEKASRDRYTGRLMIPAKECEQ
jgi:hypothetical protein